MDKQIVNTTRETAYVVGDAINYGSIYGYPKRIYNVYRLKPGEVLADPCSTSCRQYVGGIKEERIADELGNCVTSVFYEKNRWRRHGKIRFFASPEALLIGVGMVPVLGKPATIETTRLVERLSAMSPRETPPIVELGSIAALPAPRATKALSAPKKKTGKVKAGKALTDRRKTTKTVKKTKAANTPRSRLAKTVGMAKKTVRPKVRAKAGHR